MANTFLPGDRDTTKALRIDLHVFRGERFVQTLKYEDADGTPINLTGCDIRSQIRRESSKKSKLVSEFSISETPGEIDLSNGVFSLVMDADVSERIFESSGYYSVKIVDTLGNPHTKQWGVVHFHGTATE